MLRPSPQPVKEADLRRHGGKPAPGRGMAGLWRRGPHREPEAHV